MATLEEALGAALERAPRTVGAAQQIVVEGQVDFVELFDGSHRLSSAVTREGEKVGPGFDEIRVSYGQQWDLALEAARGRL
eukprot:15442112-Alexandrium_andersonii.AAC.1